MSLTKKQKDFLIKHYNNGVQLQYLADDLHITINTLKRLAGEFGLPPREAVLRRQKKVKAPEQRPKAMYNRKDLTGYGIASELHGW